MLQERVNSVEISNRLHESNILSKQHKGKTKDQCEFEKYGEEMTFKPKLWITSEKKNIKSTNDQKSTNKSQK